MSYSLRSVRKDWYVFRKLIAMVRKELLINYSSSACFVIAPFRAVTKQAPKHQKAPEQILRAECCTVSSRFNTDARAEPYTTQP
ncbi:hypothetical protein TNCV_4739291 [Trichonephila clavipes]|nr:hypothetical protein TNCV_4739291 [Trichonephila clavipes]